MRLASQNSATAQHLRWANVHVWQTWKEALLFFLERANEADLDRHARADVSARCLTRQVFRQLQAGHMIGCFIFGALSRSAEIYGLGLYRGREASAKACDIA
jgi:hypothetical protein